MSDKKIKIVFIIDGLEFGGAQRQLLHLLGSINHDRYDVSLIYFTDEEDFLSELNDIGIKIFKIKKKRKIDIGLILRIRHVIKEVEADILVTYLITADIWGRLAGFLVKDLKVISCKRNQNNLGRIKTWLMAVMDRYTDSIVANCYDVKRYVCSSEHIDEKRIDIIHNGYDVNAIRNTELLKLGLGYEDYILIGTVGRLVDVKDHDFFIEIADALIQCGKQAVFVIVGGGPDYTTISSKIEALAYSDRIKLLGARSDALEIVKSFDIYISTSKKEGFSNSIMEAMILGKTIWTTNVGAARDIIEDGINGYLINKNMGVKEICNLYDRSLENKKQTSLKALTTSDNYTIRNMVTKYEELFERLMLS